MTCGTTGFSASYNAGDGGAIVVSATAEGLTLVNTVSIEASVGISQ